METNYDLTSAFAALSSDNKSVAAYDVKSTANIYHRAVEQVCTDHHDIPL